MKKPFCKKCLLEDLAYDEYAQTLLEYIKRIPLEQRVEEEIYQKRLLICKECELLTNGMCMACGCYVQLRAIKPHMSCASELKKW